MHIYTAAVYSNNYMRGQNRYEKLNDRERDIVHTLPHILESWHYVSKEKYVNEMRAEHARIFLDSGAFSAFNLGVELNIAEYVGYIRANADIIRQEDGVVMASVLDGIGEAQKTYENQIHMEYLGVRPLPCFHSGEDERYLEWYVQRYPYITLGGMVGASTSQLQLWLDRIWGRYLIDGSGRPKLKVHGFGITSIPLMERYPWYSCDSSSWIQSAAFGGIVDPKHGPLNISEKSPAKHDALQHVSTLSPIEQDYVFKRLEDAGFTYARLSTIYESRAAYNLWAFGTINSLINANKSEIFKAQVQELY